MKTALFLFLNVFSILSLTNRALDEANGFEKFKFGTSANQYQNLNIEIAEGATKLYSLSVLPQLNGMEFESIYLTFCKDQLSVITLATKHSSGAAFLNYLTERFGAPVKIKHGYEWKSKKVHLIFEAKAGAKDASVFFYSNEVCCKP